jgi:hypothetical protein
MDDIRGDDTFKGLNYIWIAGLFAIGIALILFFYPKIIGNAISDNPFNAYNFYGAILFIASLLLLIYFIYKIRMVEQYQ